MKNFDSDFIARRVTFLAYIELSETGTERISFFTNG
jgi:hypothetical protein